MRFWATTAIEWMISFFGIILSGNIAIPLDPRLPVKDIEGILDHADSTVLLYHQNMSSMVEQLQNGIRSALCMNDYETFQTEAFKTYEVQGAETPEECCMIMFTSGTTGTSKGVMLSQKSLLSDAVSAVIHSGHRHETTRVLSVLPMFHIFALSVDILWCTVQGIPMSINTAFPEIMREARLFGVTRMCMVPMMADYIYSSMVQRAKKHPEKTKREIADELLGEKLKCLVFGGAYLEQEFRDKLTAFGLEVKCGYGMTETSCVVSSEEGMPNKEGSAGHIIDCNQVKIIDGEVCVKGDNVMLGYYRDEEGTKAVLKDGWVLTGDIGYTDDQNYLFITGKKKNVMITSSGENVSPEELEKKLLAYDIVKETIVYQKKSQIVTEIYPDIDYIPEDRREDVEDAIRQVIDKVNAANPSYKHIHGFTTRDTELEKTGTMKVKRENYYYN